MSTSEDRVKKTSATANELQEPKGNDQQTVLSSHDRCQFVTHCFSTHILLGCVTFFWRWVCQPQYLALLPTPNPSPPLSVLLSQSHTSRRAHTERNWLRPDRCLFFHGHHDKCHVRRLSCPFPFPGSFSLSFLRSPGSSSRLSGDFFLLWRTPLLWWIWP